MIDNYPPDAGGAMPEGEHPTPAAPRAEPPAPTPGELRAVNERLLLVGLREQALADQLRRQLDFTSAITADLDEGVCALDRAGRVAFVNPAAARLLGGAEADLLGRALHDLVHPHCAAACPLRDAGRADTAARVDDERFARRDGRPFPVTYSVAPLRTDGAVAGAVVAFHDTTARAALERAHEEYLAALAHDLKSPLAVIHALAQLLHRQVAQGDELDPAHLTARLADIVATANRATALVDEHLDVALARAGAPLVLDRRPVDLVALVRRVAAAQRRTTRRHRLHLDSVPAPLVGAVDAPRVERVVANLLANAIKYSPDGGDIALTLACAEEEGGHWAVLTVADRGLGIPAADLPRLGERFHRGGNVAGRIAGTGLGLASVRQIVALHGGTVAIASVEGAGTTVTVRLPLAPPGAGRPEGGAASPGRQD